MSQKRISLIFIITIAFMISINNFSGIDAFEDEAAEIANEEPSVSASFEWRKLNVSGPGARLDHAMVFNAKKNKIVLFGGRSTGVTTSYMNDTWTWNGVRWKKINTKVAPSPRSGHALAYDATRKRVILFGGWDGTKRLNDTWIWRGKSWKQLTPAKAPSARSQHDMVFDSQREVVVLFGGNQLDPVDTWEWDGENWQNVIPADIGFDLPSRNGAAMAYDSKRGMTVMFGGEVYPGRGGWVSNETWSWDGNDWTEFSPIRSPQSSDDRRMVFDSKRGVVILFGGHVRDWEGSQLVWKPTEETWRFNGKNWKRIWPISGVSGSNSTLERSQHAMAYDPTRKQVVVFGGFRNGAPLDDTWVLVRKKNKP